MQKSNIFYIYRILFKRFFILLITSLLFVYSYSSHSTTRAAEAPSFINFESPQVHPLCLTPDGTHLLVVNTPASSLSVFDLQEVEPKLIAEIPVGLEPVSVCARNNNEAWVVNWLSDSLSIINLTTKNVIETLTVGDEPTDIVFAGFQKEKAFVCVSGLAQVKIYDPNFLDNNPQIINVRGKQPRSLTCDQSGSRVFVSVFESGNQTTVVPLEKVNAMGGLLAPNPKKNKFLPKAPQAGLIVQWNGSKWIDETGEGKWTSQIPYSLADTDIVVLSASSSSVNIQTVVRGVGTHIGNSIFDSELNRLYVVNTESKNLIRFEPKLKGHFIDTRVSVLDFSSGTQRTININPHINYNIPNGSDSERAQSLSSPSDIARDSLGRFYVAAIGSAKVGVFSSTGEILNRISVGGGPTGLAINEIQKRIYVLNRFNQTISIVSLDSQTELKRIKIGYNPEPSEVKQGRRFLYDGNFSAHGDLSCASCHKNGHIDGLAWDLGNPQGKLQLVRNGLVFSTFHPMKGPMTTQSLRGIIGSEPLHWRGDKASLKDFNPAFVSLLGSPRELTTDEMNQFESFVKTLAYPPNPLQNLDRTYADSSSGPSAARGELLYRTGLFSGNALTCNQCHSATPGIGTNKLIIPGPVLREKQDFKVPQLRGLYQKVGMQSSPGEQISGFGFMHDGAKDTLLNFLRLPVFTFKNDQDRLDVAQFVLSFDTGIAPIVGVQLTVNLKNKTSEKVKTLSRLLIQQAEAKNCDLVVKGIYKKELRSLFYLNNGMFQSDKPGEPKVSLEALLQAVSAGEQLTFTSVPIGTDYRIRIDSNESGTLDSNN